MRTAGMKTEGNGKDISHRYKWNYLTQKLRISCARRINWNLVVFFSLGNIKC